MNYLFACIRRKTKTMSNISIAHRPRLSTSIAQRVEFDVQLLQTPQRYVAQQGMLERLRKLVAAGMPVLGTCAGLILLATEVDGGSVCLGTLPVTVRRNAYGRQLGSFHTSAQFEGIGTIPMTFIRAPSITALHEGARCLATVDGGAVAVRSGNQIGLAFHPELDDDTRIHELFLSL